MKKQKNKQQKSERKAKNIITVLMCLVAVCLCSVIGVSVMTDVFSAEREVKAVALVLSQAEQTQLETQLSKLTPLKEVGFKAQSSDAKTVLEFILPGKNNGLYSSFGYSAPQKQTQADPAMRFADEEGNYSYYKIDKSEIDSIIEQFDVNADHTVNTKDIYFYNGFYYFADKEANELSSKANATISVSKRIQDGRYYVTSDFGGKTVYVVANKSEDDSTWKIHEISAEPLFDQLGIMIKTDSENDFEFENKTEIIQGKTSDGVLYCEYVIKYPAFYGETAGEAEANRFYQSVLSYYEQLAQDSDKLYKTFMKNVGDESQLPLQVNYSAEVTYAKGNYIGIANEISETLAAVSKEQESEFDDKILPSSKTVEAYVFDCETGDYVTKDSIIGKDYQLIEKLLYRIYYGYDYASLLSDNAVDTAEVPNDSESLGEKIYLSAGTFCQEGFMFCFVNDEGCREDVVIPFGVDIFEIDNLL